MTTWQELTRFTVWGRPQQKGSKQPFVNRRKDGSTFAGMKDANHKARAWQDHVAATAAEQFGYALLRCPIRLSVTYHFKRPQSHYRKNGEVKPSAPIWMMSMPDTSKLMRTLEDGLTGIVYADDKLVVAYGEVEKRYTSEQERAEIVIEIEP